MANAKMPSPHRYRGKWRGQVTLKNGQRPAKTFETCQEAKQYISDTLSERDTEHEPSLGGPTRTTLAEALTYYAGLYTINKGGARAELNRINHYRDGAGLQRVSIQLDDKGAKVLQESPRKPGPSAFEQHADERRAKRSATYQRIAKFATKICSTFSKVDIRELMADMEREGLSPSTIQKEVALLRHMFNMAAEEWNWLGFKNPAEGIKLGKSNQRFVFITKAQEAALWKALSECDNPYVEHWVALALETTLRPGSVNALRWDQVDLDNRVAFTPSKTGAVSVALSQSAVKILNNMPRSPCGKVFPMSANAMDMAWDGVSIKAGVPTLRLADLRHLSATGLARRGLTGPQLQKMLGHKTMTMAHGLYQLCSKRHARCAGQHPTLVIRLQHRPAGRPGCRVRAAPPSQRPSRGGRCQETARQRTGASSRNTCGCRNHPRHGRNHCASEPRTGAGGSPHSGCAFRSTSSQHNGSGGAAARR